MTPDTPSALVPTLRFPEFANDGPWEAKPLDDVCERLTETVGDFQLTPVSISAGKGFVPQAEKFGRDISGSQYSKYIWLQHGDFAYNRGNSKRFPQGCVYRLTEFDEAAASSAFHCFRLHDHCEPAFFLGFFENNGHGRQLRRHITSGARSNGLLNISAETFFGITIPTPRAMDEQRKIADCLGSLDGLIAAESRKLEALRKHKEGLMAQLFPQGDESVPRLRFPEFQYAGHWGREPLSELCDIKHGYAFDGEFFSDEGKYVLLTPGNFYERGGYRDRGEKQKYYTGEIPRDYVLNRGDLLVAMTEQAAGLLGSSILVPDSDKFLHNQRLGLVMKKLGVAWSNEFFFYVFNTPPVREGIHGSASGMKVRHTSPTKIGQVVVSFPASLSEQQRVADCLSALDARIAAQTRKLDALKQHKQGLLQQLFPSLEGEAQ